ncbi:YfdX family protein [Hydrogenimonas urashimensis]|uniref:YfdX family protein n=1 Tax=Hydrogenimonas urashimensis TaxID=2740515 RepID=UPI001916947F|nr:YfdX family protein [Hydrogenimonas urashimensis]
MKKVWISLVAAALLAAPAAMAETSAQVSKHAVQKAEKRAKNEQLEVVQEAVEAVALTQQVLVDLDKKNVKKAKADLEKAIGKLEVVLEHPDAPALLPIDSSIVATEYIGDAKSIEKSLAAVKKLLAVGDVQAARRLLNTLQSEIDVISVNLPLVSYPQALKLAAKYLNEGKVKEARDVLEMALGTLVQNQIVIPLPLLKAQALIEAASTVAKKDKEQALKHLEAARNELKVAKALGYTSSSDTTYKMLDEAIEKIEKEVKGPNKAEKLFKELIEKLKEFKENATKNVSGKKSEK